MEVKKADLERVWKFIYEGLKAHFEEGAPFRNGLSLCAYDGLSLAQLARYVQEPLERAAAADEELLDSLHRLECRVICPIFDKCNLERCDGAVWCCVYNLGESHGVKIRDLTREQHRRLALEELKRRYGGET
jgi:hypothetical protein